MKGLLLLFMPLLSYSQPQKQGKLDSLKTALAHSQDYTQKTKIAHQVIDGYMKKQPDSTLKYIAIAFGFARKAKNVKLEARTYQLKGNLFLDQNKYQESLLLSQQALSLYESINDIRGLGNSYNNIGFTYKKMGEAQNVEVLTRKGLAFVQKSIGFLTTANDTLNLVRANNHLGIICRDLKEFKKAKESYIKALEIAERCHIENPVVGVVNANLGQNYIDIRGNYDVAISYLKKALLIYQRSNYQQGVEHANRNLADAFRMKKDYTSAIFHAEKSVAVAAELKDTYRQ